MDKARHLSRNAQAMKHSHAFLISSAAAMAAACAVTAAAMAPVQGNRTASPAAFMWFGAMAAASGALTLATAADAISSDKAKRRA